MAAVAVSLLSSVKEKYCTPRDEPQSNEVRTRDFILRTVSGGSSPIEKRKSLAVDNSSIQCCGDGVELSELCPLVEEVWLCRNCLEHWTDVATILRSLPNLVFLDLTRNPLRSCDFVSSEGILNHRLSTLILIHTHLDWPAVTTCLAAAPNLCELHLDDNDYSTVNLDPSFTHDSLTTLHLQGNQFSDWSEILKLSKGFPKLQTLLVSHNPLTEITGVDPAHFPSLEVLALNNTSLSNWESIEQLAELGNLKELRVMRVPLIEAMPDKKRRFAVIARLPSLTTLNKSVVTSPEKEQAERWMLREYSQQASPPKMYSAHLSKHGAVSQLARVDLSPKKTVQISFHFRDGKPTVTKSIKVDQTIGELQEWVAAELVGEPQAIVRLYYIEGEMDWDPYYQVFLSEPRRKLHSAVRGIKDGDKMKIVSYGVRPARSK